MKLFIFFILVSIFMIMVFVDLVTKESFTNKAGTVCLPLDVKLQAWCDPASNLDPDSDTYAEDVAKANEYKKFLTPEERAMCP